MVLGFDAKRLFNNLAGLGNYSRSLVRNFALYHPNLALHLYSPKVKTHPITDPFLRAEAFHNHVYQGKARAYWRTKGILKDLEADGIDIYHGLSHELPLGIRKSKVRSVVTIHDMIYQVYPHLFPWIDRKIYHAKFKHACERADHVVAISESTKRDIMTYFGTPESKISVVYQSCDPIFYQPPLHDDLTTLSRRYQLPSEYFLAVGSLYPRKNLSLILEAYAMMPSADRIPLVLVGRGEKHKQELIGLAQEQGVSALLYWIHDMDDNRDLQCLYQNAQALIYPSIYEGFGLPIVEALLSHTPVITSNTSSLPEAGGPDSLYIDPNRPEDLVLAMKKVLGGDKMRRQMKVNGFDYATRHFSPKTVTHGMMGVYGQLMH